MELRTDLYGCKELIRPRLENTLGFTISKPLVSHVSLRCDAFATIVPSVRARARTQAKSTPAHARARVAGVLVLKNLGVIYKQGTTFVFPQRLHLSTYKSKPLLKNGNQVAIPSCAI